MPPATEVVEEHGIGLDTVDGEEVEGDAVGGDVHVVSWPRRPHRGRRGQVGHLGDPHRPEPSRSATARRAAGTPAVSTTATTAATAATRQMSRRCSPDRLDAGDPVGYRLHQRRRDREGDVGRQVREQGGDGGR